MKKYIYPLLALLALFIIGQIAVGFLIDEKAIGESIVKGLERVSGQEVIAGDAELSILPSPVLTLPKLYVRNASNTSESNIVEVKTLEIALGWGALFSDELQFESVILHQPVFNLELSRSGVLNLKTFFSGFEHEEGSGIFSASMVASEVGIVDGSIHYVDYQNDEEWLLDKADMTVAMDVDEGKFSSGGSISLLGRRFSIDLQLLDIKSLMTQSEAQGVSVPAGKIPFSFQLSDTSSKLGLDGELWHSDKGWGYKGGLSLVSENILNSLAVLKGKRFYQEHKDHSGFPVNLKAEAYFSGDRFMLRKAVFEGDVIKGKADAMFSYGKHLEVKLKADMDALDLDRVRASGISGLFLAYPKEGNKPITFATSEELYGEAPEYSIPESLSLKAVLKVDNLTSWNQQFSDMSVFMKAQNGVLAIQKFRVRGAGDSLLLFDGHLKEGRKGVDLEGQIRVAGKHFDAVARRFGWDSIKFPNAGYAAFKGAANLLISKNVIRFSELLLLIEDKKIQGSVLYGTDDDRKTEAVLRVSGVDCDALLDAQIAAPISDRETNTNTEMDKLDLLQKRGRELVLSLQRENLLKLDFDRYRLNGEEHANATAEIMLKKGSVTFNDIDVVYKDSHFSGKAALDLSHNIPYINFDVNVDSLDTSDFLEGEGEAASNGSAMSGSDDGWSRKPLKTEWMAEYNSDFAISVSHLRHKTYDVDDFVFHGKLADRALSVSLLEGKIWDAALRASGRLGTGRYPSLDFEFNLLNVDIIELSKVMPLFNKMAGRFSLTGNVTTTGASVFSWVTNAEGTFALAGRDILVKGINISGIVRAVSVVRKVSDIVHAVEQAYPGGNALVLSADGQLVLSGGKITTNGVVLKTEFGGGRVRGYVDVHNWLMDLAIMLQFDVLNREDPPSFSVTYEGRMDDPKRRLDTNSLEAFVAKKTAGKLIEGY